MMKSTTSYNASFIAVNYSICQEILIQDISLKVSAQKYAIIKNDCK